MTAHNSEKWVPNSSISEAIFPIEVNCCFPNLPCLHGNNHKTTSSKFCHGKSKQCNPPQDVVHQQVLDKT
jgi:hypothetical protein